MEMATMSHECESCVTMAECTQLRKQCFEESKNTKWWISGIAFVVSAIAAAYVIPAVSAGYTAVHRLDTHEARQDGSFKSLESKFATLREYHGDLRDRLDSISIEQKEQRDLIIRGLGDKNSTP